MARRRVEDERFAYFAEASIVFLDLPDAVFRGYEGDDELLGHAARRRRRAVRAAPPGDRPARAAEGLLAARRRRSRRPPALPRRRRPAAPGRPALGDARARLRRASSTFYEDFPYAWWNDFRGLEDLGGGPARGAARRRQHRPEFADITDQLERKITGISLYESQIERLFDGTQADGRAPSARYGRAMAELGDGRRLRRAVLGLRPRLSR